MKKNHKSTLNKYRRYALSNMGFVEKLINFWKLRERPAGGFFDYAFRCAFSCAVAVVIAVTAAAPAIAASPAATLTDEDMHWDTRTLSLQQAISAVDADVTLRAHRELIIDRCGLHSINPRLAVLLMRTSDVLSGVDLANTEAVRTRLDAFLVALPRMYYLGRTQALETKGLTIQDVDTSGVRALAETFVSGESRFATLSQRYFDAYGRHDRVKAEAALRPAAAPANFMRLPWTLGQNGWSFNGVHTTSGGCSTPTCGAPRSSIDLSLGWPVWGADTSAAQVLAAHDGVITRFSNCNLRVTNANGWATNYCHLSGPLVATNDNVVVGQPIAIYANNTTEALCQGGSSTGPHVHFSLINAGAQTAIDQTELSGWLINATAVIRDYDSDCARMYLSRNGVTACAYNGNGPSAWAMHTLPATMPSNSRCALDIDGNGTADAATDGVLLLRYLFGFRGAQLTANALGVNPQRNTPDAIAAFVATRIYDLDGDNAQRGSSDGLLAARLLLGMTGTALANRAIGTGSARTTGAQVAAFAAGCR